MTFPANNDSSACHSGSDQPERQQSSSQRPASRENDSLLQLLMDGQRILLHGSMEGSPASTLINLPQTQARSDILQEQLTPLGNEGGCGTHQSLEEILQEAIHILQDMEEPGEYYPFEQ